MQSDSDAFSLSGKKALIVHNYDLYFERQTRIFAHAHSKSLPKSVEIDEKLEMLLLDDLTIFALAGRRLIDICGLQSTSNKSKVFRQGIDNSYEPVKFFATKEFVGFYSLLSQIIHMTSFFHFNTRRKMHLFFFGKPDQDELLKQILELRDKDEAMEGIVLLKSQKGPRIMFRMKDLIEASIEVSDKIIEHCSRHKIYLELYMRN